LSQPQNRKYTFRFGDKKIIFNKAEFEPEIQVFAKALVYAIYHKQYPTIKVEAKVDERFSPDLSATDYDGKMLFWAECGNVSLAKVEKLFKKFRQAQYVFVKERYEIPTFEKNLARYLKDMRTLPSVDIVVYPEKFAEWWVSEEGDVFIPPEEIEIIRWPDPQKR
jgi:hypothetical protein